MKLRIPDILLIVIILIGGALGWWTGAQRGRLADRYARLTREVGEMPIKDPSKVHVQALDTGEPLHFAWRVYLPPNSQETLNRSAFPGGTSPPAEFIARVRVRENSVGGLDLYQHSGSSSTRSTLAGEELVELLRGHWDQILVEQLGMNRVEAVDPKKPAVLLRLTLPPALAEEAKRKLPQLSQIPVLVDMPVKPEWHQK